MNQHPHPRAHRESPHRGFTLIEVMVAVSIFATVMLIATGAVFSIVEANKKAHSIKSVMTNLNFALESMSRDIRVGSNYDCDPATLGVSNDCLNGGAAFVYQANKQVNNDGVYTADDRILYSKSGTSLMRQVLGSSPQDSAVPITASEIYITNLKFYVTGASSLGGDHPKVTIVIQGYSGTGNTKSEFNIQTTVSQRASDS